MREIIKLTISQPLTTILVPMLFWNNTSSQCFFFCLNRLISIRVESRDLHQHDYIVHAQMFIPQAGASSIITTVWESAISERHAHSQRLCIDLKTNTEMVIQCFGSLIHSLPGSRVFHGQWNSSHLWQSQVAQLQLGPHLQSFSML